MNTSVKIPLRGAAKAVPVILFFLVATFRGANGGETLRLSESSTFGSREVQDRELRLWRSGSSRYKTLEISGNRERAIFRFSGKGGALGRISRIDLRRSVDAPVIMTGSMSGLDKNAGKYLWGVYGWVLDRKEWDDANVRHEIYVIHSFNRKETDPLIGRLMLGDKVYHMHRYRFSGGGYRFKAIASQSKNPSNKVTVDLAPFLSFWKQHGLGDSRYLHEVSWVVELLTSGEHTGNLTLSWQ